MRPSRLLLTAVVIVTQATVRADGGTVQLRRDTGLQVRATREQARNKLLYAAPVTFAKPGEWQVAVKVQRQGEETDAVGTLNVAPNPGGAASYWICIAFPMVMTLLFMVREVLIRRRSQR
jgi:hypothetical protein